MRGTVPKRDELHRAVLVYSDVRRLQSYRELSELDALFEAIIDAAEEVLKSDPPAPDLRAALAQYGRHQNGCAFVHRVGDCDCGLDAALEE